MPTRVRYLGCLYLYIEEPDGRKIKEIITDSTGNVLITQDSFKAVGWPKLLKAYLNKPHKTA